jgi:hypothetical protein
MAETGPRRTFVTLPVGIEVEVEGVAFWDDDHGQLGADPVEPSDVRAGARPAGGKRCR